MSERASSARVEALLHRLGLDQVHVLACMSGDWGDLLDTCAARIATLTIVAPHLNKGVPSRVGSFSSPTLVISGDEGAPADRARSLAASFRRAKLVQLRNYSSPMWADTVADRTTEVKSALLDFLERAEREHPLPAVELAQREGEYDGIRYRIRGRGTPVLLFPLSMAPSQWQPLLSDLSARYCTVSLGGAHLGPVALLESRARSGYGELAARVLDDTKIAPGEVILEVGCGSGALSRALVKRTNESNRIVATDINAFLLAEAEALANSEVTQGQINFERMDAEQLRYPDERFDVCISCTVMEEGDADQMLRELVRVTRPGGRVVVMTRAMDLGWCVNIPVSHELQVKMNSVGPSTGAGVGAAGCADSSLYTRAVGAGLEPLSMGPQFAVYRQGERLHDVLTRLMATLSGEEAKSCRDAIGLATNEGTLFVAEPFHCIIGTVPSRSH